MVPVGKGPPPLEASWAAVSRGCARPQEGGALHRGRLRVSCQVGLAGVLESRTRTARGQGVRAGACGLREGVGSLARPPAGAVSARAGGAARMRGLLRLRPGEQHGKGCDGRGVALLEVGGWAPRAVSGAASAGIRGAGAGVPVQGTRWRALQVGGSGTCFEVTPPKAALVSVSGTGLSRWAAEGSRRCVGHGVGTAGRACGAGVGGRACGAGSLPACRGRVWGLRGSSGLEAVVGTHQP